MSLMSHSVFPDILAFGINNNITQINTNNVVGIIVTFSNIKYNITSTVVCEENHVWKNIESCEAPDSNFNC